MENTAQSWLVFRLTHSSFLLGLVMFAGQFPVFALSLVGGVVADRYSRRTLILITQTLQMIQAFVLASLTLTNRITVSEVIFLAAFLGLVNAFDIPARHALTVEMVEPEAFPSTIVMNATAFTAARVIGPPLAAAILAFSNEGVCFLINAFSFLAVLWALLLIPVKQKRKESQGASPFTSLWEGVTYAYRSLPMRAFLGLLGLVNLMGVSYSVLMPVFAEKVLHRGAGGFGILLGGVGFGAFLGAFFIGARKNMSGLGKIIAVSCILFSSCVILFSLSRSYPLSFFLLVVVGFGLMAQTTSTNTLIQSLAPSQLRGRLMSLYAMMVVGVGTFGSLLAGVLAEHFGAPMATAIGGFACLLGAIWFALLIPRMRPIVRKGLKASPLLTYIEGTH